MVFKVMSCGLGEHGLVLGQDRYFFFISIWVLPSNLMVWCGLRCSSQCHIAYILRIQLFWDLIDYQVKKHHIHEEWNPKLYHYKNLKTSILSFRVNMERVIKMYNLFHLQKMVRPSYKFNPVTSWLGRATLLSLTACTRMST